MNEVEIAGRRQTVLRRTLLVAVLGAAVLYTPLAVNYMWFAFDSGAGRWQDALTAAVNGGDYAYRAGSVDSVRMVDFVDNRWVMLVHTGLGGIALLLMVHQLTPRLRRRSLASHRWVGRVYFVLMVISMLTALIFLVSAGPAQALIGNAFYLQLWALDFGTLLSGALGLVAIRRRNLLGHQAWMYLNFALMMTAPFLRVVWIFAAPLFPDQVLLDNLGMGSSMLGVIAPGGAAIAMQLSLRSRSGSGSALWGAVPNLRSGVPLLIALVGGALLVLRYRQVDDVLPAGIFWVPLGAAAVYLAVCVLGAASGARREDRELQARWRIFLWGAATAPISALVVDLAAGVLWGAPSGLLAGLMVGIAFPIIVSYTLVVHGLAGTAGIGSPPRPGGGASHDA
ncbi:DUF2306 domain-containing protein [Gordonia sp. L191]|uniref:DUF2306 domain-containing protein n=1 Tax=Gordonia sp. L191 TaxID=2982699 RepID=UPI0024BF32FE|nr:DUF2306 domain-containing protein [Gordonia sp. L191]WHU45775.1 DUF2306 domain-containing protein [Gordonia sp. L191]